MARFKNHDNKIHGIKEIDEAGLSREKWAKDELNDKGKKFTRGNYAQPLMSHL